MRILHATSELFPYSKTGGLADMVAGLTGALVEQGHEITIATPLYRGIREQFPELQPPGHGFKIPLGKNTFTGRWWKLNAAPSLTGMFLENDGFYDRNGIYLKDSDGYWDNPERFMFLSKAAANLSAEFDLIHVHDWQTAFIPMLLKLGRRKKVPPTVLTIHNLAYQGSCEASRFAIANLPQRHFHQEGPEYLGGLNYLKAGLHYADAITTVSPRYAREILTPQFGEGMEGVLQSRGDALTGILNGVDYNEWRTTGNPYLPAEYSAEDISGKWICRDDLKKKLGLSDSKRPLFGVVSRMAEQKGIGLLIETIEGFLTNQKLQLAVLGDGEPGLVRRLFHLHKKFPQSVSVNIKYDNRLAHQIEAAADFFLMPSRFEPCGLNQLYSLRYGTIPIVHAVGGLADTVIDLHSNPAAANGFQFNQFKTDMFANAIERAVSLFGNLEIKNKVMIRGMTTDFSWQKSSTAYAQLYGKIT